ncbi:hypothetical protein BHM03_00058672 [Ensete ventricosum]|nr:hypothetical protein BHM03_00058672 [Ensete ventricosum]
MLHPGVTQEWVDEGKLPRERTKKRIDDGGGPTRCWQRPHMEKSYSEFITRESVYNGDVTKRRHGVADRGGIVHGNATHADMSLEGHDHAKRESIGRKGAEEVENAEANTKYQDRGKGQRPRNFKRPVSMSFSSR